MPYVCPSYNYGVAMKLYVVVKVSYDYHRFENYLGIYSALGFSELPELPYYTVECSKPLADEKLATQAFGNNIIHYMIEEIIND